MAYGIANSYGRPSFEEICGMLDLAFSNGVRTIDTARTYGESEELIGKALFEINLPFRIISKLSPDVCVGSTLSKESISKVEVSLHESLQYLQLERIDTLLLHRGFQRTCHNGEIWEYLKTQKRNGLIGKIGISAVTPIEAIDALEDGSVDVIQVATSILDQRLFKQGFFEKARERGVEVHVRSIFLQGLAFLNETSIPKNLEFAIPQLRKITDFARVKDVAPELIWLSFAKRLEASHLVIGSESINQLQMNLRAFQDSFDTEEITKLIEVLPDYILDPSKW